jgi:hypothetical protein
MPHGTEQHLEESHHAEHAAHDDFNKRVAMSMAIIAACLAFVTLQSHRDHNLTLQKQIQSGRKKTEASNRWAQYQAKSIRRSMLEADAKFVPAIAPAEHADASKKVADDFLAEVKRYKTPAGEEEDPKEKPEMASLKNLAEALDKESEEFYDQSEQIHHKADRFDQGELGIELALVVCSVSVLTKNRLFWIVGLAIGVVGFLVAMSAYVPALLTLY